MSKPKFPQFGKQSKLGIFEYPDHIHGWTGHKNRFPKANSSAESNRLMIWFKLAGRIEPCNKI